MTLPATGQITINNINVELGSPGTTQASLGQVSFRQLAGVASGPITMDDFHGKSNKFVATISTNQTDLNLATWAAANGWNGSIAAEITIDSGVYVYSTSTGNAGLTTGSFPGGITLTNNGYIIGKGGDGGGGGGGTGTTGGSGLAGGTGLSVTGTSPSISVVNNGTIGGGGGGGGGGGVVRTGTLGARRYYGGGGGGGGAGVGAGGAGGSSGNGTGSPGSPGTLTALGAGGAGSNGNPGGNGGGLGSNGSAGVSSFSGGGGGGSAGTAIAKNGNTVSVTGSGSIFGAVTA